MPAAGCFGGEAGVRDTCASTRREPEAGWLLRRADDELDAGSRVGPAICLLASGSSRRLVEGGRLNSGSCIISSVFVSISTLCRLPSPMVAVD